MPLPPITVTQSSPTLTPSLPCTWPSESNDGVPAAVCSRTPVVSGTTPVGTIITFPLPSPQKHLVLPVSSVAKLDEHSMHAAALAAAGVALALPASHCDEEVG